MFSSNLAHVTSVLVSCYTLGAALVYTMPNMRDTVSVLGGGNECAVAMARLSWEEAMSVQSLWPGVLLLLFITKLLPVIINQPCRKLIGGKKALHRI